MTTLYKSLLLVGCIATLGLQGCSSSMPASDLQQAQVGFDEALELEAAGRFDEARAAIDKAMATGGLNPDQLADGYLLRSRCRSRGGDLEGATADLEAADRGSPDIGRWHWTRSILFEKQGKAADAKAELAAARRNDPLRKIP